MLRIRKSKLELVKELIGKVKNTTLNDILSKKEINFYNEYYEIIVWFNQNPFPHVVIQVEDIKNNKTLALYHDIETKKEYEFYLEKIEKILLARI